MTTARTIVHTTARLLRCFESTAPDARTFRVLRRLTGESADPERATARFWGSRHLRGWPSADGRFADAFRVAWDASRAIARASHDPLANRAAVRGRRPLVACHGRLV